MWTEMSKALLFSLSIAISFVVTLGNSIALAGGDETFSSVPIRMVDTPAVSPDGLQIAFSWLGDIWKAELDGSGLQRLTEHTARDTSPQFSPDGTKIAFVSSRTGSSQIFVMPAAGGIPQQVTFHSAGYELADWFPDGKSLLAVGSRDHYHRDAQRLLRISLGERRSEEVLGDFAAANAKLSPDGTKILFNREGERWWRKGYRGERAAQVWLFDLEAQTTREILHEGVECMWPLWAANGKSFYFTKGDVHGFDLWQYRFAKEVDKPGTQKQVAGFKEDSIVFPAISRNGKTIVFRHLFDLYRMQIGVDKRPVKIDLQASRDLTLPDPLLRRKLTDADEVAFSEDGLEIAFIAGGDVWVMDTKLREPKQVTKTEGYEENLIFAPDGQTLFFTSLKAGQVDIFKATRKEPTSYWWQNTEFVIDQVTDDAHVESSLKFTPDGKQLLAEQGNGDLIVRDIESGKSKKIVDGFSSLDFDISPDGRWVTYASQDNEFNSDIWIVPTDGSAPAVNVSRHPDNDFNPRFSPDGKLLAFTGRHFDQEVDIFFVYLQEADHEQSSRERKLDEAVELMKKKRKPATEKDSSAKKPESPGADGDASNKSIGEESPAGDKDKESTAKSDGTKRKEVKPVKIDFDRIHERLRRISVPNSTENGLFFSPDGKKLVFAASVDGKRGWYSVEFPGELTPKLLASPAGASPRWTEKAGGILCLQSGKPTKIEPSGKQETYAFEAAQETSRSGWLATGFEKAWITMRERWYDPRLGNRNWDAIRRKYRAMAEQVATTDALAQVIELMLGELNGSHLGFTADRSERTGGATEGWNDETAHLGVRFDDRHAGPGLLVRDVLPDSPADREKSKLFAGDVILAIDGHPIDPAVDLTTVLNGTLDRDIKLRIQRSFENKKKDIAKQIDDKDGGEAKGADEPANSKDANGPKASEAEEIEVTLRPISYGQARGLLYDHWLRHNREAVDKASAGKLGYLHIRAMDESSFFEFERQLYNVGYGRDGLIIDVRDNGGGSTTDMLLTALTQPRHAITVPRDGGQGYPHDRIVFASWSKPIIVLCNQNSYSNAEIFSHAIKTLKRGKVVGVRTAGGVVSTGAAGINDVGRLRIPFRGWFLPESGEDMELNGCEPDVVIWPLPDELPRGVDKQLDKAVEILMTEVAGDKAEKALIYSTERK